MRTTLTLDDDVVAAARAIASVEGSSIGRVISALARRGLIPASLQVGEEDGFPVFVVPPGAAAITDHMVRDALDEA